MQAWSCCTSLESACLNTIQLQSKACSAGRLCHGCLCWRIRCSRYYTSGCHQDQHDVHCCIAPNNAECWAGCAGPRRPQVLLQVIVSDGPLAVIMLQKRQHLALALACLLCDTDLDELFSNQLQKMYLNWRFVPRWHTHILWHKLPMPEAPVQAWKVLIAVVHAGEWEHEHCPMALTAQSSSASLKPCGHPLPGRRSRYQPLPCNVSSSMGRMSAVKALIQVCIKAL